MKIDNLVTMANQIGTFFASYPDQDEASTEIANHLQRYWAPRMRIQLYAHIDACDAEGLAPIVVSAIAAHRGEKAPPPPPGGDAVSLRHDPFRPPAIKIAGGFFSTSVIYLSILRISLHWNSHAIPHFEYIVAATFLLTAGSALAADLTVSAAASLTNAFKDIAAGYEAQHPGSKVALNFGASGALLQQIAKGAPVDVFASRRPGNDGHGAAAGLVRPARPARFRPQHAGPDRAGRQPPRRSGGLDDLAQAGVKRIAIGIPASVPVGPLHQTRAGSGRPVGGGRAEGHQHAERAPVARLRGARRSRCRLRLRHRCRHHEGQGQGGVRSAARYRHQLSDRRAPPPAPTRPRPRASSAMCCRPLAQAVLAKYGFRKPYTGEPAMDLAWIALTLSLKVAGWATALNLVLGVAVGYALARLRFPGRDVLDSLLTLPMVMPPTVLGYYLLVLMGRRGWLGGWLHDSSAST